VCRAGDVKKSRGAPAGQVQIARFKSLRVAPTPFAVLLRRTDAPLRAAAWTSRRASCSSIARDRARIYPLRLEGIECGRVVGGESAAIAFCWAATGSELAWNAAFCLAVA